MINTAAVEVFLRRVIHMILLDSPIWKELDSSGSDTYEVFHDLMEGKGDFREDMEFLGEDS